MESGKNIPLTSGKDRYTYLRSHVVGGRPVVVVVGPLEKVLLGDGQIPPVVLHVELVLCLKHCSLLHSF